MEFESASDQFGGQAYPSRDMVDAVYTTHGTRSRQIKHTQRHVNLHFVRNTMVSGDSSDREWSSLVFVCSITYTFHKILLF